MICVSLALPDIIVQFHLAYFDEATGLLITNPATIRKHYLETTFVADLLGVSVDRVRF